MRKSYIKPPMLSTSFSESGKKAKRRFENILNTKRKKKGLLPLALVVFVIVTIGALVACDSSIIGAGAGSSDGAGGSGNAGGQASVQASDNYLEKLYESKIKYVGDNSGVSNILNLVFADDVSAKGFELKTADDAPKGIIVNLNGQSDDDTLRESKAITVLLLVENCDYIQLSYEDAAVDYTKTEAEAKHGVEFSDIMKSYDSFSEFYRDIFGFSSNIPIEQRLGSIIIEYNSGRYYEGECPAEGHIILATEGSVPAGSEAATPDKAVIYALISYGEYAFENGNFVKISGSGVIPTRITLDKEGNMTEYSEPEDGSGYESSIKEMFPEPLWERALTIDPADSEICGKQEKAYAESYLKSIGREAEIGDYADFEYDLPEMDDGASNKLLSTYSEYPYWIGTEEKLEIGVRYVYEKQWDNKTKVVTYKKYEYDTNKVADEAVIDTTDGKLVYLKGQPREN